jgi:hypothetical protein
MEGHLLERILKHKVVLSHLARLFEARSAEILVSQQARFHTNTADRNHMLARVARDEIMIPIVVFAQSIVNNQPTNQWLESM